MDLNEEIVTHYNSDKRQREVGRYYASDIYKIRTGLLTEKNFFDVEVKDMRSIKNIFRGLALEDGLKKVFDAMGVKQERTVADGQLKFEHKLGDGCVLVMKPDFVLESAVLETKAPNKLYDKIPDWYLDQCEIQYRLIGKPVVLTQINIYDNSFPLLVPIEYEPSDKRWEEIQGIVIGFDKKLREVQHEKE